jgi:hypothetical protein
MLKRTIKYEDFNGVDVVEDFYFNLSKSELIEMEAEYNGGLSETLNRIIEAKDNKTLIAEFKKLVLNSYGQKSIDGKRFMKSDALREEFSQTPAYDVLFMELASNEGAAGEFINGIMPKDMSIVASQSATSATAPQLPPPASTVVDI